MDRRPVAAVHPAANEAALRSIAKRLHDCELDLAIAVGNLVWKDILLAEHAQLIADLKAKLEETTKPPIGKPSRPAK